MLEMMGEHSQGFWDEVGVLRNSDLSLVGLEAHLGVFLELSSRLYLFFQIPYGGRILDRSVPGSYDLARQGFLDPYGEIGLKLCDAPRLEVYLGVSPSLGTPHLFLTITEPVGSVPLGTGATRLSPGIRLLVPLLSGEGEGSLFYTRSFPAQGFYFVEPISPLLRFPPLDRVGYTLRIPLFLLPPLGVYMGLRGFHEAAMNKVNAHWGSAGMRWEMAEDLFEVELQLPLYGKDYPLPPPWNFLEPEPFIGTSLLFRWVSVQW